MKNKTILLASPFLSFGRVQFVASAPGDAGWKTDENGALVLQDGNPVWVAANGQELTVNGGTITNLGTEARTHRLRAEQLAEQLAKFNGIDPEKARDAFSLVERVNQKELIEKGELDQVRAQVAEQYQAQVNEANAKTDAVQNAYDSLLIDNAFAASRYIADNVAVPVDMFRAQFGRNFTAKDGKVIAIGPDGNPMQSNKKFGEIATFDEAVETIVSQYQFKDNILKAPEQRGSGNIGGGGNNGAKRNLTREQLQALPASEQAAFAASMSKGEAAIIS